MSASERRSAARTAVVWEALRSVLSTPGDVLDIGGGTGGFAVGVAELGHRVAVVDPSPDALAALGRRAHERGVADRVTGQQGDLSSLLDIAAPGSADVVLCHGVLEVVEDPAAALATIADVLRPGGTLSLLVAQRHAAVLAKAMAGHFQQAKAMLESPPGDGAPATRGQATRGQANRGQARGQANRGGRRFTAEEITTLLTGAGFEITAVHGIRVFADLVPGALLDAEPGAAQALVELEQAVAERSEYLPLATQVHVLAKR